MRTQYRDDPSMDPSGFVLLADYVPHIVQEIRYYSTYNFIGERIDGYEEPCALLTVEAARALKAVSAELIVQGLRLKVFDAYRPACAVKQFVLWGIEDQDIRMKPYFYPDLEKQKLFSEGYIASRSSHSRGSAVDLTLLDMQTGKELDMGSPFDLFSPLSHPDCRDITEEQYEQADHSHINHHNRSDRRPCGLRCFQAYPRDREKPGGHRRQYRRQSEQRRVFL